MLTVLKRKLSSFCHSMQSAGSITTAITLHAFTFIGSPFTVKNLCSVVQLKRSWSWNNLLKWEPAILGKTRYWKLDLFIKNSIWGRHWKIQDNSWTIRLALCASSYLHFIFILLLLGICYLGSICITSTFVFHISYSEPPEFLLSEVVLNVSDWPKQDLKILGH